MDLEARGAAHPWSRQVFVEELARDFATIATLREAGRLVAFLVSWRIGEEVSILDVVTDPALRRRGHAARLLEHTVALARKHRCTRILLEVRRGNLVAQRLYRKYGFRPIGIRAGYYVETHEDAIVMRLQLTS